jgi:hypothetical protein
MVTLSLHNTFLCTYIHDYLCLTCLILFVGRSNAEPLLDEEDTESDTPIPNRMVTEDDIHKHLGKLLAPHQLLTGLSKTWVTHT